MKNVRNIAIGTMATLLLMAVLIPAASAYALDLSTLGGCPFFWDQYGGVMNESGAWLYGDGDGVDDCFIEVIRDGDYFQGIPADGIDPPDSNGNPTGNDELAGGGKCWIGNAVGIPNHGQFWWTVGQGQMEHQVVYVRAWNAPTKAEATYYGDSDTFTMPGADICTMFNNWSTDTPKPAGSKFVPMEHGWNGISLCYEPSSSATADVLSSIAGNYSAVKKWDASSDIWVDATTMERGTGYFVYVNTSSCTWEHTGQNMPDPMEIPLKDGLNFVGYPFDKTNSTSDALAGLSYYYAAPFDASTQKYVDTYNPVAPAPFNNFKTINPCEGFWISSKGDGNWNAA